MDAIMWKFIIIVLKQHGNIIKWCVTLLCINYQLKIMNKTKGPEVLLRNIPAQAFELMLRNSLSQSKMKTRPII
jgi:hypothetical protein